MCYNGISGKLTVLFAQGLRVACAVTVSSTRGKKRCCGQTAQGSQPAPAPRAMSVPST